MLKITIKVAWDAAPWGLVNDNQRFGGAYWPHLQSREVQEANMFFNFLYINTLKNHSHAKSCIKQLFYVCG